MAFIYYTKKYVSRGEVSGKSVRIKLISFQGSYGNHPLTSGEEMLKNFLSAEEE